MQKQQMKRALKKISKPVKKELFKEVGFTDEEILLMQYLYIDKINQPWVSDELGISLPTLTKLHNTCIEHIISFYNFEKYKHDHNECNCFNKYFADIE